jgi:crotonobetainyl-CoA:carnitine CoA-transferase CaiB-like acyl-CoA transferase
LATRSYHGSTEARRRVDPPFGQDGPKAGWAANDLTVMASSGAMVITGDDDRAPCVVSVPQAYLHAGAEAAVGALVALAGRDRDGAGQHVDVSAQVATMMATQATILEHGWNSPPTRRIAGGVKFGGIPLRFIHPCADGYVSVTFLFGTALGPFSRKLMEVMCEEGIVDEATRDKDWLNYTSLILSGQEPVSELMRCTEAISEFTRRHTKSELFRMGMEKGLLIVPVATVQDVVHSEQLADRGYWQEVEHPEAGLRVKYPGAFARFSKTPIATRRRRPDSVSQRRGGRGDREERPRRRWGAANGNARDLPLKGLKVADFMWVVAGPWSTRYLVDYRATVVRIEATRVDTARTIGPFKDGQPGPERSGAHGTVNAGKYGVALNLQTPEGHAVALKLCEWADVVTESFTPGSMARLGLDYESVRKVNPGVIMISSCLNGQDGPHSSLAGFGTMGAQIAGFGELAGWPDRAPAGPAGAYTDYIAPKFEAAAILAALEHRRRTGEGQHIDFSQVEAAVHFISPRSSITPSTGGSRAGVATRPWPARRTGCTRCRARTDGWLSWRPTTTNGEPCAGSWATTNGCRTRGSRRWDPGLPTRPPSMASWRSGHRPARSTRSKRGCRTWASPSTAPAAQPTPSRTPESLLAGISRWSNTRNSDRCPSRLRDSSSPRHRRRSQPGRGRPSASTRRPSCATSSG